MNLLSSQDCRNFAFDEIFFKNNRVMELKIIQIEGIVKPLTISQSEFLWYGIKCFASFLYISFTTNTDDVGG